MLFRSDKKVSKKSRPGHPSDDALVLAAQMIGAVVLARLVDDESLVDRILDAAKRV